MPFGYSIKLERKKDQLKSYTGTESRPFYPLSYKESNDYKTLIELYNIVGDVNAYIRYISDVGSKLTIRHYREQTNGKFKDLGNTDQLNLIYNPNKNTSKESFFKFLIESLFVTGVAPIYKINTSSFGVTSIYQLPSESVYPIPQYSIDLYGCPMPNKNPIDNPVVKYHYFLEGGKYEVLNKNELIYIRNISLNIRGADYYKGFGKLYAAVNSINSLKYLYSTINNILNKGGALGFVKKNLRTGEQITMLSQEQKKEIENKFYEYSASKGNGIAFTDADLSYVKIFDGLSQFMPIELKDSELETIANCLGGFPRQLLNGSKQNTYNNVKEARKALITNIEMPVMSMICSDLTKGLNLPYNEYFEVDYSEIEELQQDKKLQAESQKIQDDIWINRYNNNLVTMNQTLEGMELPKVADGDNYKTTKDDATPTI